MKLKLFSIDFAKNTITFKVPREIMGRVTWKSGFAVVDVSEISDSAKEQGVEDRLADTVRKSQVHTGEQAVIANLKKLGF